MKYFVIRDGQSYGPYTLADLQRYVADGSIALSDMARSEAMPNLLTVQQILGNIPAQPMPPPQQTYGRVEGYMGPQQMTAAAGPMPPGMNWGLLLFLYVITCGVFGLIWIFVQASFVKKIKPDSSALMWYGIGVGGLFMCGVVAAASRHLRDRAATRRHWLVCWSSAPASSCWLAISVSAARSRSITRQPKISVSA